MGGESGNDAEKPHTKAHMCVLLMCNPIPIILLCILSVFHLYLLLYLNLYLYLYLKKPHTQAHMCVLLMCNPTPHPDGIKIAKKSCMWCQIKHKKEFKNQILKFWLGWCIHICLKSESVCFRSVYKMWNAPHVLAEISFYPLKNAARGCLDSQLTPPKSLGLPQIAGICLRCQPPPRISGRYISPLTAMAFSSSYLVRRIPEGSHGKSGTQFQPQQLWSKV